jgi:putative FmdB family regulatory protein
VPRYDLRCQTCGQVFEAVMPMDQLASARCECGGEAKVTFARSGPAAHVWQPRWYEHITDKPLYIESKRQLKAACKQYGVISHALD